MKVLAEDSRLKIFVGNSSEPAISVSDDHFSSGMIGVRDFCTDEKNSISGFTGLRVKELMTTKR